MGPSSGPRAAAFEILSQALLTDGKSQAPLEQCAAEIYASAKVITAYCNSTGHAHRSFDKTEPPELLPNDPPQVVLQTKQRLVETAMKILQLANDPNDFIQNFQIQYQQLAALRWLCHFNVLAFIPLEGSVPFEAVATSAKVPIHQLKSLSRMAMLSNFLREPMPGELAHTSTSASFVKNPALIDWAKIMSTNSSQMAAHTVEATERYGSTKSKYETAFNCWKGTDKSYFEHVAESEALTKQFANYMKIVTSGKETSIEHLVTGYDWTTIGGQTIVDLGGSSGHASIALAEAYPGPKFIVQDLPDTIEKSKPEPGQLPSEVASRISYQHHDFFTTQPLKDVDVFLLRMIIHDWPDQEAKTIISNLLPGLKKGGKLIVMDTVLPRTGSAPLLTEARLRVRDLTMMQVHNAKEREIEEWDQLFKSCDERLRIASVSQPFGSSLSILEVVMGEDIIANGGSAGKEQTETPTTNGYH